MLRRAPRSTLFPTRRSSDLPLLNAAVNLPQIVDAGVHLRGGAGFDEVGDGDRSQKADDGHYDHDFHQREAALAGCADFHTSYLSFVLRRRSEEHTSELQSHHDLVCRLLLEKKI